MKKDSYSLLNNAKLILTLSFTTLIFSCKKDINTVKKNEGFIESKISSISQKVSGWYKSEIGKIIPKKIKNGDQAVSITTAFPLDETQYFPDQNMAVTPVVINKKSVLYDKYLVNYFDRNGKINVGFYIDILAKGTSKLVINNSSSNIEYIQQGKIPKGFTGTIILSDMQGNNISSGYFENGLQKEGNKREISAKIRNNDIDDGPNPILDNPVPPEGCTYESVEWYLIIFDEEGNILDIEYLGTSQVLTCPDGGGGGGGGDPITASEIAELIFAAGQVKSEKQTPIPISETPQQTIRKYPWMIYKIYYPGILGIGSVDYTFFSEEIGTRYLDNNNRWRWQSFTHSTVRKVGYTTGISFQLTDISAVPNIYPLLWWDIAGMSLTFTPEVGFVFNNFNFGSAANPLTTGNAWLSTNNGLPIPGDPQ